MLFLKRLQIWRPLSRSSLFPLLPSVSPPELQPVCAAVPLSSPLPTTSPELAAAQSPSSPHRSPVSCCHCIVCPPRGLSTFPLLCLSSSFRLYGLQGGDNLLLWIRALSCALERGLGLLITFIALKPDNGSQDHTDFPFLPRTAV